jgi:5-methylcytosine-specific restriction protein A
MKLRTLKPQIAAARWNGPRPLPATAVERKRGSAGVKDRNAIKARDHGLCQLCRAQGVVRIGYIVDHRIPLADGGSDEADNKWCLCVPCHDAKTAGEATARARR